MHKKTGIAMSGYRSRFPVRRQPWTRSFPPNRQSEKTRTYVLQGLDHALEDVELGYFLRI